MTQPGELRSNRREFITTSTAAMAALAGTAGATSGALDPRLVNAPLPKFKPHKPVGKDEAIRMALIGAGGMGNGHMDGILRARRDGAENVNVVAVSEVAKKRRERTVKKLTEGQEGVEVTGYVDYMEMLEKEDLHAVLIASPEHWHAQMAIDAMAAGCDVYLEKPMTLRLEEAIRLKRAVDSGDKILQVGTQYMMLPKYEEARRLIKEGAIGQPTLSQTSYCRNSLNGEWLYGIDADVKPGEQLDWDLWCGPLGKCDFDTEVFHRWRRYRKWSTGIIGDLLVHMMTPMIYALDLGYPTHVTASGGHMVFPDMDNHDQVMLTVEFENGHTMIVAGSVCNDRGLEVLVRGHEGDLLLGGSNLVLQPQSPFTDDVDPQTIDCSYSDEQGKLRLNWLSCVRTREPNRSTVDLGLKHMIVVDLATRSMWDKRSYRFDPYTMRAEAV